MINSSENGNMGKEDEQITTFELGDDLHPVDEEAEVIEFIGERIRRLENLEKCKNLKVKLRLTFSLEVAFEKECYS